MHEVEEKILRGGVGGEGGSREYCEYRVFFFLLIILLCDFNKF